jgi:hypothetical protein
LVKGDPRGFSKVKTLTISLYEREKSYLETIFHHSARLFTAVQNDRALVQGIRV